MLKMETCDISLVKQEIVELIKTEPQNENEFDTCGQSGIKTEESNIVGVFKETINYDTKIFQTSDVEMKFPWDGCLPIKEQIKDESDTSNSVDEIVKNEIILYDSSFGTIDSKIDHFTPVDKSEIKLEQDQFTFSSEILQTNIIARTSSVFNLNIECVNENQDLSFNALHKKAECRNLSLKRLGSKFHNNITTEYKTSLLNSDQTKFINEYQGAFNDNVYKIQNFSDNHLTGKKVKENVEINISRKNPKLRGLCVSTEATDTKCKLDKHSKKGIHCIPLGEGRISKNKNFSKNVQVGGNCIAYGGSRKCKTKNCTKNAKVSGRRAHGGRFYCKTENCTKIGIVGGHCTAHGGGRKCKTENCTKNAKVRGHCSAHGGRIYCKTENCTKISQVKGRCTAHGGGRICKTENCTKNAQVRGYCRAHGEGRKCKTENCIKMAQVGGNCISHGGGRKCKTENCTKNAQVGGCCRAHGGRRKCKTENCTKNALVGGNCISHGGGTRCKTENCTKNANVRGHCSAHGGRMYCKSDNCTKIGIVGGHCTAHGGGRKCNTVNFKRML